MRPTPDIRPRVSPEQIETFQRDGVVVIRNAVDPQWVASLLEVAEEQLAKPSQWVNDQPEGEDGGRLFTDRYLWPSNERVRSYAFDSGIAALVGQLMQSSYSRLYFDHLLVKDAGTAAPTPWHQDVPYWPFTGKKIASAWLALSDATVNESAMEFVRASHSDGTYYAPAVFGSADKSSSTHWQVKSDRVAVPDIEADRSQYDIVGWDMKAGDAVIFSAWLLHGARGNASADNRRLALSTRWLGDDAIWAPHAGTDPTVTQADVSIQPGEIADDNKRFPLAWSDDATSA